MLTPKLLPLEQIKSEANDSDATDRKDKATKGVEDSSSKSQNARGSHGSRAAKSEAQKHNVRFAVTEGDDFDLKQKKPVRNPSQLSDTFVDPLDLNLECSRYSGAQMKLDDIYKTMHAEYMSQLRKSKDQYELEISLQKEKN